MKLFIFLGFVALAVAVPLKDTSDQSLQGFLGKSLIQGIQVQKGKQEKKGKIQKEQSQAENTVSQPELSPLELAQKALARQAALQVVQDVLQAKQSQLQTAAKQLQQEALIQQNVGVNGPQSAVQPNQVAAAAIEQLEPIPNPQALSQLAQTLEVAFEAQSASNNVEKQQKVQSGLSFQIPSQDSEVFQSRVQQLVRQNIIQDLQEEIDRKENIVQQLQQQRQFVSQQKQQLQAQIALGKQGQLPQELLQLQQAEQRLQQQEQYLLEQQIVLQIVIQKLHKALLDQQNQLQQDSLVEQAKEQQVSQFQVSPSNQWNLANQQFQGVNSQYQKQQAKINEVWAQPANQWTPIRNVRSTSVQSVYPWPQNINEPQIQANTPWFQPANQWIQLRNQPTQDFGSWSQPTSQGSQQVQANSPWPQTYYIGENPQLRATNPWFQPTNVWSLTQSQQSQAGNPWIQPLNQGFSAATPPIAPWFQIASQWSQLGQQLSLAKNQTQPLTSLKQNIAA